MAYCLSSANSPYERRAKIAVSRRSSSYTRDTSQGGWTSPRHERRKRRRIRTWSPSWTVRRKGTRQSRTSRSELSRSLEVIVGDIGLGQSERRRAAPVRPATSGRRSAMDTPQHSVHSGGIPPSVADYSCQGLCTSDGLHMISTFTFVSRSGS
jgi:hypothetical protein